MGYWDIFWTALPAAMLNYGIGFYFGHQHGKAKTR